MITKSMLGRSLQKQKMFGSMIQCSQRAFAGGGPSKAPIDKDETEFDLVVVGEYLSIQILKIFLRRCKQCCSLEALAGERRCTEP